MARAVVVHDEDMQAASPTAPHRRNVTGQPGGGASLARRALDVARDSHTPFDVGTEHLLHLTTGRRAALVAALAELDSRGDRSPDTECARQLLVRAISLAHRSRP